MRFAGPDVVLFVVGALLFSGSVYGLIATDSLGGGGSAVGAYNLAWTESTNETSVAEFGTDASAPFNFTITDAGVTLVTVTVACQHAAGVPESVATSINVEVTGPGNLTGSGSGACGTAVPVEIPVAEMPSGGTIQADSPEAAEAEAVETIVGTAAVGDWSGEATFSSSGGGVGLPTLVQYSGEIVATLTLAEATASPVGAR